MCITVAMVLVALTAARVAAAAPAPSSSQWTHVRPLTPSAARFVADAAAYAPAVRHLLDAVERTDVVVYVTDATYEADNVPLAYVRFVGRAAGLRYVSVYVDRFRLSPIERIASLGHELQHVLEIATAPGVRDSGGLRQLYERIGWECGRNRFETDAARAITRLVKDELAGFGK